MREFASRRLVMRCPAATDTLAINSAIHASWPELAQWMDWAQGSPPSLEYTASRVDSRAAEFSDRTAFSYGVFERATGAFVGMASLLNFDWKVPKVELGYWLSTEMIARGYATEAAVALTDMAFELGLVRIEIRCDTRNIRSRRVAERAGFELEGILRNECLTPQGQLRDTCVYARIRAV